MIDHLPDGLMSDCCSAGCFFPKQIDWVIYLKLLYVRLKVDRTLSY